jgi:hypothetical protein
MAGTHTDTIPSGHVRSKNRFVIANACLLPVESKAFASALVHSGLDVSHVREILAD